MTEIILDTDEKAAKQVTLTLWKSLDGYIFTEEKDARYRSCTHRACRECGKPVRKHYLICALCQETKANEEYALMPSKPYNGSPFYSDSDDIYFFSEDELGDYCDEQDIGTDNASLSRLRLVFCEPSYAKEIDPNDYYCDYLPEDGEIDDELMAAFDTLNAAIRAYKKPLSWSPSKVAVRFSVE